MKDLVSVADLFEKIGELALRIDALEAAAQKQEGVRKPMQFCSCGPVDEVLTSGPVTYWQVNANCPVHGGTASAAKPAQEPEPVARADDGNHYWEVGLDQPSLRASPPQPVSQEDKPITEAGWDAMAAALRRNPEVWGSTVSTILEPEPVSQEVCECGHSDLLHPYNGSEDPFYCRAFPCQCRDFKPVNESEPVSQECAHEWLWIASTAKPGFQPTQRVQWCQECGALWSYGRILVPAQPKPAEES